MGYQVVNRTIKAGFFTNVENRVERAVQEVLDDGVANGWRLHTLTTTDAASGVNLLFVWETPA